MRGYQRYRGGMLMIGPGELIPCGRAVGKSCSRAETEASRLARFHEALADAEREVASWPEWKRIAAEAGLDMRSTNKTPRQPVDNSRRPHGQDDADHGD